MVETKFPKFNWGTISEKNAGHTPDEWGLRKKKKSKTITAYTVTWDEDNTV